MRKYGALELTDASPAQTFTEPITKAEVRTWLNITESSPADSEQDALLDGLISAAREKAELLQGRDLIPKQYDLYLDYLCGDIELRTPLVSVDLVRYTDSDGNTITLSEGTDYVVDTARGLIHPPYGETWPSFTPAPSSAVLIRFTSGYSADHPFWLNAGQRILMGMRLLITIWHENRLPADGELPPAVTVLLSSGAVPRVH